MQESPPQGLFGAYVLLAILRDLDLFVELIPPDGGSIRGVVAWPRHLHHEAMAGEIFLLREAERGRSIFEGSRERHRIGHRHGAAGLLRSEHRPAVPWHHNVVPYCELERSVVGGKDERVL